MWRCSGVAIAPVSRSGADTSGSDLALRGCSATARAQAFITLKQAHQQTTFALQIARSGKGSPQRRQHLQHIPEIDGAYPTSFTPTHGLNILQSTASSSAMSPTLHSLRDQCIHACRDSMEQTASVSEQHADQGKHPSCTVLPACPCFRVYKAQQSERLVAHVQLCCHRNRSANCS